MNGMAVEVKKLDLETGDVVEIGGRRYDVVSEKVGRMTLEPGITKTVAEIHVEHEGRPLSGAEFEQLFGDLPTDGEG